VFDDERRRLMAAGAGLAAMALLPATASAQESGGIGVVDELTGAVFRRRDGAMVPLKRGDRIFRDDELVTGRDARMQVRLDDGAILVLGAGTRCLLKNLQLPTQEASGRGLAVVGGGILRVILRGGGAWQGFSVQGSTAIASVRGTDFVVESDPDNTAVFVVTGLVSVEGMAGGSVRLSSGQGTDVARGERPTRAKRWGAARVGPTMAEVAVWP